MCKKKQTKNLLDEIKTGYNHRLRAICFFFSGPIHNLDEETVRRVWMKDSACVLIVLVSLFLSDIWVRSSSVFFQLLLKLKLSKDRKPNLRVGKLFFWAATHENYSFFAEKWNDFYDMWSPQDQLCYDFCEIAYLITLIKWHLFKEGDAFVCENQALPSSYCSLNEFCRKTGQNAVLWTAKPMKLDQHWFRVLDFSAVAW